jgi:polysaccharide pyruvyl transferase WcaK-like protein
VLVIGDEVDAQTQAAVLGRPELEGLGVRAADVHGFGDVLEVASGCRALIGSRYHNVVAAVVAGIPAISLGYGPKNAALLEQLGAGGWSHDVDDFSVDRVLAQVLDAARCDGERYRSEREAYREQLRREFEVLAHE